MPSKPYTRDHSDSGAVDNWTGHEHIYIGHFEIIYPSLNVFFDIYVYVKVDSIDFLKTDVNDEDLVPTWNSTQESVLCGDFFFRNEPMRAMHLIQWGIRRN